MARKYEIEKIQNLPIARIRETLNLTPITINDYEEVVKRVDRYLVYCDEQERIPTVKGLCASMGITTRSLNAWLTKNPEHETSKYLAIVKELLADNLEQGALNGSLDKVTSIFLLKSQYQYREDEDYTIKLKAVNVKGIEQLQNEIDNEIIEADFSEKEAV